MHGLGSSLDGMAVMSSSMSMPMATTLVAVDADVLASQRVSNLTVLPHTASS
jgi:hypothetical protein